MYLYTGIRIFLCASNHPNLPATVFPQSQTATDRINYIEHLVPKKAISCIIESPELVSARNHLLQLEEPSLYIARFFYSVSQAIVCVELSCALEEKKQRQSAGLLSVCNCRAEEGIY